MILCLDTLTPYANVTLLRGGRTIGTIRFDPYQASERALQSLPPLLRDAQASPKDLTALALIQGPGSFTGLRVGLSMANVFSQELKLPSLPLRTDQWWAGGIEEENWVYLQSMNRSEFYAIGFGEYADRFKGLIEVERFPQGLPWSGIVSDPHRAQVSLDKELKLPELGQVWQRAVEENQDRFKKGESMEAFYLKKPKITAAKVLDK